MIKIPESEKLKFVHQCITAWDGRTAPYDVAEVEKLMLLVDKYERLLMGAWTTTPPTELGVYWIRVREDFEKEYHIAIANVALIGGKISLWYPKDGYECDDLYHVENVTHWLGPLRMPLPIAGAPGHRVT